VSDLKQPGQRAYEIHTNALGLSVGGYFAFGRLHPDHQRAWAAVEAAFAPAEPEEGGKAHIAADFLGDLPGYAPTHTQLEAAIAKLARMLAAGEGEALTGHIKALEQEVLDLRALERLVRRHLRAGTFHVLDARLFEAVLGGIVNTRAKGGT
jgi:hypothetical protein